MFCPNCGNQLDINATNCSKCGQTFTKPNNIGNATTEFVSSGQVQSQQYNQKPKTSNNKVILIILVIAIIGVAFYFGKDYIFKGNKPADDTQQNSDQPDNNTDNKQTPDNSSVVPSNDAFLFPIEDVFTITGRGTVVTGQVVRGSVKVGDEIEIVGLGTKKKVIVSSIEMFRNTVDEAVVGDNAGLLLKDISRDDVERGQVLAKVNSIGLHTKFKASIYVLSKEEGGRQTPFFSNYKPQFYFRTTDVTGVIELSSGVEMLSPGDNGNITVDLENSIAMEVGTEFSIREGGRTVGKGTVTEIIK